MDEVIQPCGTKSGAGHDNEHSLLSSGDENLSLNLSTANEPCVQNLELPFSRFRLFPLLPEEIRLKILNMVLPAKRVLKICAWNEHPTTFYISLNRAKHSFKYPALLGVSKSIRNEYLRPHGPAIGSKAHPVYRSYRIGRKEQPNLIFCDELDELVLEDRCPENYWEYELVGNHQMRGIDWSWCTIRKALSSMLSRSLTKNITTLTLGDECFRLNLSLNRRLGLQHFRALTTLNIRIGVYDPSIFSLRLELAAAEEETPELPSQFKLMKPKFSEFNAKLEMALKMFKITNLNLSDDIDSTWQIRFRSWFIILTISKFISTYKRIAKLEKRRIPVLNIDGIPIPTEMPRKDPLQILESTRARRMIWHKGPQNE